MSSTSRLAGNAPTGGSAETHTDSELRALRRDLREWYRRTSRPLPWRASHDPYTVWISEIMLQQTTVAAVVPFYERFLARFPTVADLAAAEEREVLKLWEGLGYYSRARNLRRAAQLIVSQHAGRVPADLEQLQALPGVGRYTAGAIVSFAFDKPAPIVEANTLRLYSRLLGFDGDPRSAAGQRVLWSFAGRVLPRAGPGEINQALMELGSTVCTPVAPACGECPLAAVCRAREQARQDQIPLPAKRPTITPLSELAVVVRKGTLILLMQRLPGERWAGLWDFLRFDAGEAADGVEPLLLRRFGLRSELGAEFHRLTHGVTRYRIELRCLHAAWRGGEPREGERPFKWVTVEELAEAPLPVTGRKIARLLESGGQASSPPERTASRPRVRRLR